MGKVEARLLSRVLVIDSHRVSDRVGLYSIALGLVAGIVHIAYHLVSNDPYPGDFVWALRTAYAMLHGIDPYGFTPDPQFVPYPLPVALFGSPFVWTVGVVNFYVPGAVFVGVSTGLLSWSMLRASEGLRLAAILLSGPFWVAIIISQWSPLIVAAWYLPVLAPLLVLIKPHIALPVAAARLPSRLGLLVAAGVLLASLAADPTWPMRFLQMVGPYQAAIPLLTLPFGPLVLLAALRWRDERARLLLLMAVLPQRAIYDLLALWIVPKRGNTALVLSALSWVVVLAGLPTWPAMLSSPDIHGAINLLYIAALATLFWPRRASQRAKTGSIAPEAAPTSAVAP